MTLTRALIATLVVVASSVGCSRHRTPDPAPAPAPASAAPTSSATPPLAVPTADGDSYDLIANLPGCDIRHRGISLDFGTPATRARRSWAIGPFTDTQDIDREGASFVRVFSRRIRYDFWLDEPEDKLFVALRVHSGTAHRVSAYVDNKHVGGARLATDETRVVVLPGATSKLDRGRHTLLLRFWGGRSKGGNREPYAELDWARLGIEDDLPATYSAPTLKDIVADEALDGKPRRSIVLRSPSSVRCAIRPTHDAHLRVWLGYWGAGRGVAEIRVVRDGEEPVTLAQHKVTGGQGATWTPLDVDLGRYASQLVGVELVVEDSTRGGRVMFGDPTIVHERKSVPEAPTAKTVVLVVSSAMERRLVPPWGPIGALGAFGELSRSGVAFSSFRVPTTVPAAVVASMLTGLEPRAHALEDQAARLPRAVRTIAGIVKEASGRTAMFTGVPTTSAAFGFDAGWDRFESISPVTDQPSTAPYLEASKWLDRELGEGGARRLVVIHERGLHPPWDLDKDEVAKLPPEEYEGVLDARRGGIILAKVRARRSRKERRLRDQDWTRLRALQSAAIEKENDGLSQLVSVLKKHNAWEDALVIFAGDVASGEQAAVPYDPAGSLSEDRLIAPLVVKFPGDKLAGTESKSGATSVDVARTVLDALGLKVPDHVGGVDLWSLANGVEPVAGRPFVATLGTAYATRVGSWLLHGHLDHPPRLCRLDVDPACLNDVLGVDPIAAQALWQWTFDVETAELSPGRKALREPANIDPDTAAALTVWGDIR